MGYREKSLDYGENVEIANINACYSFFNSWYKANSGILDEIENNGKDLDKANLKRLEIGEERYLVAVGFKGNRVEYQQVIGRIIDSERSIAEPVNGEIDMLEDKLEGDVDVLEDPENYLAGV